MSNTLPEGQCFSVHSADLCMVCIMTHGADYNEIVDIHGKAINVENKIIRPFYNSNAKDLIGCRNVRKDFD